MRRRQPASAEGGQMDKVFTQLAAVNKDVVFVKVEAEKVPEVAEKFDVSVVPTFVFTKGSKVLGVLQGANAPELAKSVAVHKAAAAKLPADAGDATTAAGGAGAAGATAPAEPMDAKLKRLTTASHTMLFMKGTPDAPRCKFSRRMVDLLNAEGVEFGSFDILSDPEVRAAIKDYAKWPTFPMLFVGGELKGGLDVVTEMKEEEGSLKSLFPPEDKGVPLEERLRALVSSSKSMLFMKGVPDAPRCGFSRRAVALLREHGVPFESFDILTDNSVREGLKKVFNWPTFPQLYVDGNLVGGLDVLTEMAEDDEPLAEQLGLTPQAPEMSFDDKLRALVKTQRVMLMMKGEPDAPRCGFSRQAIELLRSHDATFGHFDILTDESVRAGLKKLFNWPTFPQLYIDGELVGGLDVLKELEEEGELAALLNPGGKET